MSLNTPFFNSSNAPNTIAVTLPRRSKAETQLMAPEKAGKAAFTHLQTTSALSARNLTILQLQDKLNLLIETIAQEASTSTHSSKNLEVLANALRLSKFEVSREMLGSLGYPLSNRGSMYRDMIERSHAVYTGSRGAKFALIELLEEMSGVLTGQQMREFLRFMGAVCEEMRCGWRR
jgi:hypothetical protein